MIRAGAVRSEASSATISDRPSDRRRVDKAVIKVQCWTCGSYSFLWCQMRPLKRVALPCAVSSARARPASTIAWARV